MKTVTLVCFLSLFGSVSQGQIPDGVAFIEQICYNYKQFEDFNTQILKDAEYLDSTFISQPGEGFGELTFYYMSDSLYLIRDYFGVRKLNMNAVVEYYIYQGNLIFVHEREYSGPYAYIDADGTVDINRGTPVFEGRYYFDKGLLLYKNTLGESFLIPNEKWFDSQSKEGQLMTTFTNYLLLLNR